MTELQKRAKEYLTLKGVKSTGDKFIALEVMDLLCEFSQKEQLNIGDVSLQRELLIADFIEKYNKGLVGNERIHEDCLEDYLQGNL
jgi:hypothetical protein